jgi:hypothetical protein
MNEANFTKLALLALIEVFFDERLDLFRKERMEVK